MKRVSLFECVGKAQWTTVAYPAARDENRLKTDSLARGAVGWRGCESQRARIYAELFQLGLRGSMDLEIFLIDRPSKSLTILARRVFNSLTVASARIRKGKDQMKRGDGWRHKHLLTPEAAWRLERLQSAPKFKVR
jgi:hypothetical protein